MQARYVGYEREKGNIVEEILKRYQEIFLHVKHQLVNNILGAGNFLESKKHCFRHKKVSEFLWNNFLE